MDILDDLKPKEEEYPPFVNNRDERARYDLCFALTRLIAQRDDPVFCRQLYSSDMPTGDMQNSVAEALNETA